VNTASRIESLNKEYETTILVSEAIRSVLSSSCEYLFRSMDLVRLKGKGKPVLVHELKCLKSEATDQQKEDYHSFEMGLQAYFEERFNDALEHFNKIENKDHATRTKIMECQSVLITKPNNWSFVKMMYNK
jgi:adenylate cyclase